MTNRDSFIFYRSFFDALIDMDKESQADCLMAIADYALNGKEPKMTPAVRMFFTLVKPQLDANQKKYESGCKGAGFGKFGGRPKKNPKETPEKPQENPKETPNDNVNVNENVNDNENVNENVNDNENVFNEFWDLYTPIASKDGRFVAKGNRKSCQEKFNKLINKGVNYETIIRGLEQYLKYCQSNGICSCGAEVFLNQRRWENDYSSAGTIQSNVPSRGNRQCYDIIETARKFAESP